MNGYSKLRLVNKSRSIDFSDLSISKTLQRQNQKIYENITSGTSETDNQDTNTINHHELDQYPSKQHQQDEDEDPAACSKNSSVGAKYLRKNYSVSSAISSHRFKLERQGSTKITRRGIQSAVKKAFSMRRSSASSVSHEKYCRIHDQFVAILLDDDDVDEDIFEATEDNIASVETVGSMGKKKCGSKSRILKTCKRFLGF